MDSNSIIKKRLQRALSDKKILLKVSKDFSHTFERVGLNKKSSKNLTERMIKALIEKNTLSETESKVISMFNEIKVRNRPFLEVIKKGLRGREKIIVGQVKPYLKDIDGKVIDFGAGSGEVAQLLHDDLNLDIEAVDIRKFKSPRVKIPFKIFNGKRVPVKDKYYNAAVMTNVAHHEKDNENIIDELTRIVSKRLVIIETVPSDDSWEEWERTFVNDALWNRFFNYANIPVPGTYERPEGWIKRFEKHKWKLVYSKNLGYDQPTIRDLHHLLVFEKRG